MFESEEKLIADNIKDYIKNEEPRESNRIMLRNGRILDVNNYPDMVNSGKVNPKDAYVRIGMDWTPYKTFFHYPFLYWYNDLLDAYLSKLGFYSEFWIAPATGLKYVAYAEGYGEYLTIEVSNLDTVVNNLNLPKIVFEVLGEKLISGKKELTIDEYEKIANMLKSQSRFERLFAGYNFDKALDIIHYYYDNGDQSLAKEVARITMDYDRIFQPYRVCYNMKTWKEIDCWSIKL